MNQTSQRKLKRDAKWLSTLGCRRNWSFRVRGSIGIYFYELLYVFLKEKKVYTFTSYSFITALHHSSIFTLLLRPHRCAVLLHLNERFSYTCSCALHFMRVTTTLSTKVLNKRRNFVSSSPSPVTRQLAHSQLLLTFIPLIFWHCYNEPRALSF